MGTSVAGSPLPLTTGNDSLDITIVKHLQYCTQLIQVPGLPRLGAFILKSFLPAAWVQAGWQGQRCSCEAVGAQGGEGHPAGVGW